MTAIDYIVLGILFISIFLSVMRGLVRAVLSLAGWIVAFIFAGSFSADFEPFLPSEIGGESLRILVSFVVVFISVLLVTVLVTMLLSSFIKGIGLGFVDRILGAVFGFLRGLLVITVLVLIAGLTSIPQQNFWQQALFSDPLEVVAMQVIPWLPNDLASRIIFEEAAAEAD